MKPFEEQHPEIDWPIGLLTNEDKHALYRLAIGRKLAVDIGTFRGCSALILALACEHVHTVDLYANAPSGKEIGDYAALWAKHPYTFASSCKTLCQLPNISAEEADACDAAHRWNKRNVDLLFIDADHSEAGTLAIVSAWWPLLISGAHVLFHDDNDAHPGVQQAVEIVGLRDDAFRLLRQNLSSITAFEVK